MRDSTNDRRKFLQIERICERVKEFLAGKISKLGSHFGKPIINDMLSYHIDKSTIPQIRESPLSFRIEVYNPTDYGIEVS